MQIIALTGNNLTSKLPETWKDCTLEITTYMAESSKSWHCQLMNSLEQYTKRVGKHNRSCSNISQIPAFGRKLRVVSFSANPIDGVFPSSVGNFSDSLQIFEGEFCKLKGIIPKEIGYVLLQRFQVPLKLLLCAEFREGPDDKDILYIRNLSRIFVKDCFQVELDRVKEDFVKSVSRSRDFEIYKCGIPFMSRDFEIYKCGIPFMEVHVLCTTLDLNSMSDNIVLNFVFRVWRHLQKIDITNEEVTGSSVGNSLWQKCKVDTSTLDSKSALPPEHSYWEKKEISDCFTHHLRFVTIRRFTGHVREIRLINHVIKNAAVLKKLVIHCSNSISTQGAAATMGLLLVPRASIDVSIVLMNMPLRRSCY
ncbi:hypothetical protein FXO38_32103 [Capsicum annuum]|nr:hypothetical protein FXO38_32103 [Capsicum annuum]